MAVPTLPDATRTKLAKLLGMLGSDHQGERDNAAVAAHKLVQQAGMTWEQVLHSPRPMPEWVGEPRKPPPPRPPDWTPWDDRPGRTYERSDPPKDRYHHKPAQPRPGPYQETTLTVPPWRKLVKACLKERVALTEWEGRFLNNLKARSNDLPLSEKQRDCLVRIAKRVLNRDVTL